VFDPFGMVNYDQQQDGDALSRTGGGFPAYGNVGGPGRGNELEDMAVLIIAASQGASAQYIRAEAKMRMFTRSDASKLLSLWSTVDQLQRATGVPNFAEAAHFVERVLRGRRRRRGIGIKTVVRALAYANDLARLLARAGSGLARLVTRRSAPAGGGRVVQFRRRASS